jgi:hypothetical protein
MTLIYIFQKPKMQHLTSENETSLFMEKKNTLSNEVHRYQNKLQIQEAKNEKKY